ncbi:S8 family serine peptidase [Streptomyces sp. WAC 06738]|uniref:S8 family serine peptidase n=1 Tax=Streptomyces sp. WAC 06738 TaxID=2203210 RepID=UPI001F0BF30A|nr:S8 family serine peptidase [Streptomyces sp. WAC 06738]
MSRRSWIRRGLTVLLAALPLTLSALPAQARPADPVPSSPYRAKAESKLIGQLAARSTGHDRGKVAFWVVLKDSADLGDVGKAEGRTAKARELRAVKTEFAEKSQAPLIDLIEDAGAAHTSFWISNQIKVTGTKALAEKLAARSDVAALEADDPVKIPDPLPGTGEPKTDAVEWNVDRINAPRVWNELGGRGEDVVIANIDTGVQYDHPALKSQYRGLKPDGTYDHDYNWFDPAKVCTGNAPCDNNGHGTHTMGTMAGDDKGANQVGVAPGARWIAAKGCESGSCSRGSLLASGQWIVAPTDQTGANPRPDLAPDVVNNSWGANVIDTWYKDTVQSWRAAGIFPAFSNGNAGPSCNTSGSPGAYDNSYSSGAFDINNTIASFSSRGTGENGIIKPNLAAPGVNIRSAWAGGGYNAISGTSMASPHTAATVALMWSAAPAIRGDIAATEEILDETAVDVDNTTCGGTAARNNVFGEGRLDAFAAVNATPRGALGALRGTVTSGGSPLADATVTLDGPMKATRTTAADGTYTLPKGMVGDYRITVSKYGYLPATTTATIVENETVTKDVSVDEAPTAVLKGVVSTETGAEAGASIVVQGTPARTTSAADGSYELTLPVGTYDLAVTPASRCAAVSSIGVELTADTTKNLELASRADTFGTTCRLVGGGFPTGDTKLTVSSNTTGTAPVALPFPVSFYGKTYRNLTANTEGSLYFGPSSTSSLNGTLPTTSTPNGALYPFWDNLQLDADSGIYTSTQGTAPHRTVTVEWRDVVITSGSTQRISFSVVAGEDGSFSYHYKDIGTGSYENGSSATIGVENPTGTDALLYSFNQGVVSDGLAIGFRTSKSGLLSGTVTDANDNKAVADATVTVAKDGSEVATGTSSTDGTYLVSVPAGTDATDYDITITGTHYSTATAGRSVKAAGIEVADATLTTALVTAASPAYELVVPAGQSRTRTLEIANSGTATGYTVAEKDGADWVTPSTASGTLEAGDSEKLGLTFDTTGATPGSVLTGTLLLDSESGRRPVIEIPLKVVVPAYQAALDSGASAKAVDALGDTWGPDQEYTSGSFGYLGTTSKASTKQTIAGTNEQALYSTAREGAYEYRFDGLPDGVYEVDLGFAELGPKDPARRVFDVMAEGGVKVDNLDIALEAGIYTAEDRTVTVTVTDGQLNLRLVAGTGKTLINKIRVSHRPDLS